MNLVLQSQQSAIGQLEALAVRRAPSLLIAGPEGCGKSWLARRYAQMLSIVDFVIVEPTVAAIREIADVCAIASHPLVVCVENLDQGVVAASYTLLKFLEEPQPNIYVVVTARDSSRLPDTIPSRCIEVEVATPTSADISAYLSHVSAPALPSALLQSCCGFSDIDKLTAMSVDQRSYLVTLPEIIKSRESVSGIVWKLTHGPDNSAIDPTLVMKVIIAAYPDPIKRYGIACISDIQSGRVAAHTAITKFIFDCKCRVAR